VQAVTGSAGRLGLLLLALAANAGAEDLMDRPPWAACTYCHGEQGRIDSAVVPALAGQSASYIAKQLDDFRRGRRDSPDGQMRSATMLLDAADDAAVARHFAALGIPDAPALHDDVSPGGRLYWQGGDGRKACVECHAPRRDDLAAGIPYLFGLNAAYLARQLRAFRAGQRSNDAEGAMRSQAATLSDAQIGALATYLSSVPVAQPGADPAQRR
jgi:cytochrome c553